MIRIMSFLILLAHVAFAGQSLNLKSRLVGNNNVPVQPLSNPWRVELYLHDWDDANTRIASLNAIGVEITIAISGSRVILFPRADNTTRALDVCNIDLQNLPQKRFYLRYQKDPVAKTLSCETWDMDGNRFGNVTVGYTADIVYNLKGFTVGADVVDPANRYLAFIRVCNTLLPLNSRPPLTKDDANRIIEWKFDNSLQDAMNQYPPSNLLGGSLSYVTTPVRTTPVATIKTANAPFWADWISIRAGYPARLDASASYSQSDNASAVSYAWRQIDGPSTLVWDDPNSATPVVRGAVFGNYRVGLSIVDAAGVQGAKEIDLGAVATDNNGVVIHANPDVEKLFGPMIAFGKNPWAYADDTAMRGVKVRSNDYVTKFSTPPEWTVPLAGTVSYDATGDTSAAIATLTAGVTATSTFIPVSTTAKLNLTTFPTIISIATPGYGGEEVLICSAAGLNLVPCYDGRGYNASQNRGSGGPGTWASGERVYQHPVVGVGTNFLADFCPAGVGLEGQIQTNAGTVAVTPGSTTIMGTNTAWETGSGGWSLYTIRIEATHAGGTPFVFFSEIVSNTANSMVLKRPFPADADVGSGLHYAIIKRDTRAFSAGWTRADGSTGYTSMLTTACISDTMMYWNSGFENIRGPQNDKSYSYVKNRWISSGGVRTINFYDEVLANYAMYFRSGWKAALDAARAVGDYWLNQPDINEGWISQAPRNMSVAGTVAGAVLDGRVQNWYALRRLAAIGVGTANAANCNDDVRETAYQLMWLAFAATFDPVDTGDPNTPNQRSYWKAKLVQSYARDAACKGSDNSFSSAFNFNPNQFPQVNVTTGSTSVTGSGFSPAMCPRIAGGTGEVANGSGLLTILSGTLVNGVKIVISGRRGGLLYTPSMQFLGLGSTTILGGLWDGESGIVSWQVESDDSSTMISRTSTVSLLNPGSIVACTYNSPTSITLSQPWTGSSGNAYLSRGGLIGLGQQPFLAGIKTLQMKYASLGATGDTAKNYADLAASLANWILEKGYDPSTGGLFYGRVFPNCEPLLKASQPGFQYRNMYCDNGIANGDKATARALLAEAQTALRVAYEANPSRENRETGDQFYANLWGKPGFTQQGFMLGEGGISNDFATNQSLSVGKWYGFQFGIGMAHQWPAVRLGGVQRLDVEQVAVNVDIAGVEGAAKARLSVMAPSGRIVQYICSDSPCQVDIDRRQGDHWLRIEYLSATDELVLGNDPQLLSAGSLSQY